MSIFAVTQIPLAIAEGLLGVLLIRILRDVAMPELVRLGIMKDPAATTAAPPPQDAPHDRTGA